MHQRWIAAARTGVHSVWPVAALVLVLYGLWIIRFVASGHDPRDFAQVGTRYIQQSQASPAIRFDPTFQYPNETGYDGEFFYFIALDPAHARYYMDDPNYRYGRIVYPLAARLLALGRIEAIPWTLIIVNWLAIGLGTLAVAAWLRRNALSPWFALTYGLYPGLHIALMRDLSEATSYAFVALAFLILAHTGRREELGAALALAVAMLARETAVLFAALAVVGVLLKGTSGWRPALRTRWRQALLFAALAAVPVAAYRVFVRLWLGPPLTPVGLEAIPFSGLVHSHLTPDQIEQIRTVLFPALIVSGMSLWALARRTARLEASLILVNVLVLVALAPRATFADINSSSRVATGVVLAAIYALPSFTRLGRSRAWFWSSSVLWLSLMPFLLLSPIARLLLHPFRP